MKIYSAYNLPPDEVLVNGEPSMAHREFKDECDINIILKKIKDSPSLIADYSKEARGSYLDCTSVPSSYAYALQKVVEARDDFLKLPYKERLECDHDPAKWLDMQMKKIASTPATATAPSQTEGSGAPGVDAKEKSSPSGTATA